MKKYLLWFRLLVKRQLHYRFMLLFLAELPVCVFIVAHIPDVKENSSPKIGIYMYDNDSLSHEAAEALVFGSNDVVTYYIADSEDSLRQSIIKGDTDCGYVFRENLNEKIRSGNYRNSILLLKSPSSVMSSLSSEMVFFTIFREFGKDTAINYIADNDAFARVKDSAVSYVDERFDYYLNGPATFHVNFKTLDISSAATEYSMQTTDYNAQSDLFPLRGILSVIIFLGGLFGSVQWLTDKENGVFITLPTHFSSTSRIMYPLVPTILFAISSIVTLIAAGIFTATSKEVLAMLIYIILVTAFSVFMSLIIRHSHLLIAVVPAIILCALVCCPIFFDLSSYMPFIAVIRKFLVPSYYLNMLA